MLAAVPPERAAGFEAEAARAGVPVAAVGVAEAGAAPPRFLDAAGRERVFARASFSHF